MPSIKDVAADEVSEAAKRRFLARLLFVLCGGMFLDGYILGIIGPVIESVATDLAFTAFWSGLIGAAALFGIFMGSPLGGWLGDKSGSCSPGSIGGPRSSARCFGSALFLRTSRSLPSPRAC
jgi:putative MFS transporter